jgi:hypothetical protein
MMLIFPGNKNSPSLIFDATKSLQFAAVLGDDGSHTTEQSQTESVCQRTNAQQNDDGNNDMI